MKAGIREKLSRGRAGRVLRPQAARSAVVLIVFTLLLGTALGAEQETTQNKVTASSAEVPVDEFERALIDELHDFAVTKGDRMTAYPRIVIGSAALTRRRARSISCCRAFPGRMASPFGRLPG